MKIFLLVDMEGISGVVGFNEQAKPDGSMYQEARKYLLSDVNAAVQGALKGGAKEVVIFDMHFYGLNLKLDELPP